MTITSYAYTNGNTIMKFPAKNRGGRGGRGRGNRYHSINGRGERIVLEHNGRGGGGGGGRVRMGGRGGGRGGGRYSSNRGGRGGRGGGRFQHQQYHRNGDNNNNNNNNMNNNNNSATPNLSRSKFDDPIEEVGIYKNEEETMSIAVEGCCHGELDAIYNRLQKYENDSGRKIDLLLCCGDFQSLRCTADYHSLAVPPKYRSMGSFYKYYSGEATAPYLTIFVGGNHEASQSLMELHYGGWVAPKIYYLGNAGVVDFGDVRIGGISGIFKKHDYNKGRHERPPYCPSSLRSVYHVRNVDAYRLKCFQQQNKINIMLSHDWPRGVYRYGDERGLMRKKPYFRNEIERNELGSPVNWELLTHIRPSWWFAAHLHVAFRADVPNHNTNSTNKEEKDESTLLNNNKEQKDTVMIEDVDVEGKKDPTTNITVSSSSIMTTDQSCDKVEDKIENNNVSSSPQINTEKMQEAHNDSDQNENKTEEINSTSVTEEQDKSGTQFRGIPSSSCATANNNNDLTAQMTRFLSLDKCMPRRQYLSVLHLPSSSENNRKLRYNLEWLTILKNTHHLTVNDKRTVYLPRETTTSTKEQMEALRNKLNNNLDIETLNPFVPTLPPHRLQNNNHRLPPPLPMMGNPQTDWMFNLLQIPHVLTVPCSSAVEKDKDEISLEEEDDNKTKSTTSTQSMVDENEIDLDDL